MVHCTAMAQSLSSHQLQLDSHIFLLSFVASLALPLAKFGMTEDLIASC